jgi:hypothetical protein
MRLLKEKVSSDPTFTILQLNFHPNVANPTPNQVKMPAFSNSILHSEQVNSWQTNMGSKTWLIFELLR